MCSVHGVTAAPEAEMTADPVGNRTGQAAGQGFLAQAGKRRAEAGGGMREHPVALAGRDGPGGQGRGEHLPDVGPPGDEGGRPGDLTGEGIADDDPGPVP